MIEAVSIKIPAEVRAAMTEIARKFGKQGGKKAAQNTTPEQRVARAKKAAKAAAEKRTATRLASAKQAKKPIKCAGFAHSVSFCWTRKTACRSSRGTGGPALPAASPHAVISFSALHFKN